MRESTRAVLAIGLPGLMLLGACPDGRPPAAPSSPGKEQPRATGVETPRPAASTSRPARDAGAARSSSASSTGLKLPHVPEAAHCYEKVAKAATLAKGLDRARAAAETADVAFAERLDRVMKIHVENLKLETEAYGGTSPYMCCAWDLLRALFVTEARRARDAGASAAKRRRIGEALKALLMKLPFEAPQWKQGLRETIRKEIEEAAGMRR